MEPDAAFLEAVCDVNIGVVVRALSANLRLQCRVRQVWGDRGRVVLVRPNVVGVEITKEGIDPALVGG